MSKIYINFRIITSQSDRNKQVVDLELYDLNPFSDAFLVSGALEGETQSPLWSSGKFDPSPQNSGRGYSSLSLWLLKGGLIACLELWKGVFNHPLELWRGILGRLYGALKGGAHTPSLELLKGGGLIPLFQAFERRVRPPLWCSGIGPNAFYGAPGAL